MPFHRRRTIRHRSGGMQRRFEWIFIDATQGAAVSGNVDLLNTWRTKMGITANLPDMTCVRIRGVVNHEQTAATVLNSTSGVCCGIIVLPSTIPSAQIPKPLSDPWNDWLYWRLHSPFEQTATGASASLGAAWEWAHAIDGKAMRRLKNIDDTLWFSWEVQGAQTVTTREVLAIGMKLA